MKVFLAGATGAIGKPLVAQLIEQGHELTALTRSPQKAEALRAAGATPVVGDALDRDAIMAEVCKTQPEAVIHELTAIRDFNPRTVDRDFAQTNRLRTEGTDNLLAAAKAAGARRFLAQSFAGWPFARDGKPIKDEDAPLGDPPASMSETHAAIHYLEDAVVNAEGIEGIVLRYGGFYGPGTGFDQIAEQVRARKLPVIGDGAGIWSFIQIEDAAAATVAALERGRPGIYQLVDDEPAPSREWLPGLAQAVGAKPPRRVPVWLARLLAGDAAVTMMTKIPGASNAKAKRELGWQPRYASWREGFRASLA